jgi:hypothetical protein
MRDVVGDVGLQPHNGLAIWSSPDVKVCPTPADCGAGINPVVGTAAHIVVQLRNPGPYGAVGSETGVLRIYRSAVGGGYLWPGQFTLVTSASLTVPDGVTTVALPWTSVPGPGHFSLLAVWDSPNDPLPPLVADTALNVRNNNNVAWRGVDSVL